MSDPSRTWRIAGINFDHMHMGDNLRMAFEHPRAEIVGICDEDPARMRQAIDSFSIPPERVFTDYRACIEKARPDLVILCPATAAHADWVERVAPFGVHVVVEKPFASSLAEADRMIRAMAAAGKQLAINWPLTWYASHRTAKRMLDDGLIGRLLQVHYYDGNRGPLYHVADKVEVTDEEVARQKPASWFYQRSRGGGSLLDYLGYGTTLGTWYMGGRAPIEVTTVVDQPAGLKVDEHSVTVARYDTGLSKFETRWGTFTDPWKFQPQPKCGFVLVGEDGTISSYDYDRIVTVQTRDHPEGRPVLVDPPRPPTCNPIQYVLDRLERGEPIEGPLSPALSRVGQQIVDTAVVSARERRTVPLLA